MDSMYDRCLFTFYIRNIERLRTQLGARYIRRLFDVDMTLLSPAACDRRIERPCTPYTINSRLLFISIARLATSVAC